MRERADEHGVAEVQWVDLEQGDGSHTGIASGKFVVHAHVLDLVVVSAVDVELTVMSHYMLMLSCQMMLMCMHVCEGQCPPVCPNPCICICICIFGKLQTKTEATPFGVSIVRRQVHHGVALGLCHAILLHVSFVSFRQVRHA